MPVVSVDNLVKKFPNPERRAAQPWVDAVDGVTFLVKDGEIFTLLGPSGCGKTTTLRCIAGLEKPTGGEIRIGDTVVFSDKVFVPPEKRNLGMVFQSYAIWPHMTVFDNVAYPLKVRHMERSGVKERVRKALELVKLEELENRPATQISGGQQQRVALARALVYEPSVILLDEPLSNLDAKLREYMRSELRELLQRLKMTTVYVTHDQIEALTISDTVGIMIQGKLLEVGSAKQIYHSPQHRLVAEFIGSANFIEGKVVDADRIETSIGMIQCAVPSEIGQGEVLMFIRPENITVSREKPPARTNVFEATVASSTFVGEHYDCVFSIQDQQIRANVQSAEGIDSGRKVFVHFDPQYCRLIKF